METAKIAWAAGLFEGEGSICIFEQKHNVLPLIRLCLLMTDRDVVERFCRIMECGRVTGEHRFGREHHKPTHRWQIGNRKDVERILLMLLPWLCERRSAKAREALAEIAKLDMVCEWCGKTFRSHRISSRFCCSQHRSISYYYEHRPEEASHMGRPRTLHNKPSEVA